MSTKYIGLDIDGVIADFTGGVRAEFQEHEGVDIFEGRIGADGFLTHWDCFDHLTHTQRLYLSERMGTYDFWHMLADLDALYTLRQIHNDHYRVFITNRPRVIDVIRATHDWLDDRVTTATSVVFTHNKGLATRALNLDAHLDDHYQAAYDIVTHSNTRAYLLKRPYNVVKNPHPEIRYVETVSEFMGAEKLWTPE